MDIWEHDAETALKEDGEEGDFNDRLRELLRERARDFVKGLSPDDRARLWLVLNTLYNPNGDSPPDRQALINACTDDLVEAAS